AMSRSSPSGRRRGGRSGRRSGVALLIVIAMLALLAMVGLSFVFYSEYESDAARYLRLAQIDGDYDLEPEKLMSFALGQLIFGVDPDSKSALLGHDLARSIYGPVGGTIPFNGLGRDHPDNTTPLKQLKKMVAVNVPYTYPDTNNPFLASVVPDFKGTGKSTMI